MAVQLTAKQRNVILAGGVFLICFLTYWFVLRAKMKDLTTMKSVVRRRSEEYATIGRIEAQFKQVTRETDPVKNRIAQRGSFDLSAFVARTEKLQNFPRQSAGVPHSEPYGNYEKHYCTFTYNDKSIYQIVEFLKEIEKPENVISVESLSITPVDRADPSRLKIIARLATVVEKK